LLSKYAKKTTLVILLDAFSKTYFSKKYMPFLYDLSRDGVLTHIEPLFAFKGIETTIFTGVWPSVHNVWTEFCFADSQIGSKKDVLVRKIIEAIDLLPNDESKAKLRYAIEKYIFQKAHRTPSLIPAVATAYFQPSQRKEITEPGAVGKIRTIFDVFRKKGIRFVFIEPWIWGDAGVLRKAKKLIKQEHNFNFWYLKFNQLDHLGHKIGPTPFAFKEQLLKIDRYVKEIVTLLQRKTPNLNVLVLADHGMSKVRKTENILESLNHQKSEMYKDYVAFVDSTVIRFWFFTKKARQEICEHLRQIKCGHILTDSEKNLLKMPLDIKYGETIFVVDEGYVLHPCFFHSKSLVNGMHGYAYPKTPEALPIIILNDEIAKNFQISERVTYTDIAQVILQSLLPDFSTSISAQRGATEILHPTQRSLNSAF
jgi:predicted AlkP superfamily pyrophosphatase or phosphodiesterase